jgi:hypothetical protein
MRYDGQIWFVVEKFHSSLCHTKLHKINQSRQSPGQRLLAALKVAGQIN